MRDAYLAKALQATHLQQPVDLAGPQEALWLIVLRKLLH